MHLYIFMSTFLSILQHSKPKSVFFSVCVKITVSNRTDVFWCYGNNVALVSNVLVMACCMAYVSLSLPPL